MPMRSLMALLTALCLLCACAGAEEDVALHRCTSVEQVLACLDIPALGEDGTVQPLGVREGALRYISQGDEKDPLFCAAYWQGGEPGDELDLTLEKGANHKPYRYFARNMCTRAVYSMILSYFGEDLTPGGMSALMGQRDLGAPYDEVTALLPGLQRVDTPTHRFDLMWADYQREPERYSPIYLYIRKPSGVTHALLVVAATGKPSEFIVVDPAYRELDGQGTPVYLISMNKNRKEIIKSNCFRDLVGSKVKWFYQWEREKDETP